MIDIDFFADAQEYLNNKGSNAQQETPKTPVVLTPVKLQPEPTKQEKPKILELFPEVQGFTISEDCTTLTHQGITYTIPDFYNKRMIAQRDKKTLDMVFISLGLDY